MTSRKGNAVIDTIMFLIVVFIFALVSFFGYQIFNETRSDITNDITMTEAQDVYNEVDNRYTTVLDGLLIFILIGLWVAGIVSAYMSSEHPMLFGFLMLAIVFVVIVGAYLANFFEEFFMDAEYTGLITSFPMTNWAITHLMQVTIMVALSIVLALLAKNKL